MILTWITVRSQRTFSGSAGRTGFRQASRRTDGTTGFDTDGDGRQFLRPTAYGAEQGPPMTRQDSARTPASDAAGGVPQRLADGLGRRGNQVRGRAAEGLRELGAIDRAVYSAVAATPTPSLDEPLRRLSNAANNSGLWLAAAAGLGVAGGGAGRRAAVRGTVAIGVTSALVNLAVKSAWSRQRPDRARHRGPGPPERADAVLDIVPVWSRSVGVRLRRGHRPGPALARTGAAVPGGGGGVLPGAHRSALPGRRRDRRADRRGHRAGRGRPDGPAAADWKGFPVRSR